MALCGSPWAPFSYVPVSPSATPWQAVYPASPEATQGFAGYRQGFIRNLTGAKRVLTGKTLRVLVVESLKAEGRSLTPVV